MQSFISGKTFSKLYLDKDDFLKRFFYYNLSILVSGTKYSRYPLSSESYIEELTGGLIVSPLCKQITFSLRRTRLFKKVHYYRK